MRRAAVLAALAVACAGHSEAEPVPDDENVQCAWERAATASYYLPGETCRWSMRSLDVGRVRLRFVARQAECIGPFMDCAAGCERVTGLQPQELAEVWASPGIDGDGALALTETSPCE